MIKQFTLAQTDEFFTDVELVYIKHNSKKFKDKIVVWNNFILLCPTFYNFYLDFDDNIFDIIKNDVKVTDISHIHPELIIDEDLRIALTDKLKELCL